MAAMPVGFGVVATTPAAAERPLGDFELQELNSVSETTCDRCSDETPSPQPRAADEAVWPPSRRRGGRLRSLRSGLAKWASAVDVVRSADVAQTSGGGGDSSAASSDTPPASQAVQILLKHRDARRLSRSSSGGGGGGEQASSPGIFPRHPSDSGLLSTARACDLIKGQ